MSWRYWVKTAAANPGEWVDPAAQLMNVELAWELNGTCSGKATIPAGQYGPNTAELLSYWRRFGVAMYAEQDGEIAWGGICTGANPSDTGMDVEFIGSMGWLGGVPANMNFITWQATVGDVIAMLVNYSQLSAIGVPLPLEVSGLISSVIGDPEPPPRPETLERPPGVSADEWEVDPLYLESVALQEAWDATYSEFEPYKIQWWNSPYVGTEIDKLINAVGANYRERYTWDDVEARTVRNILEVAESFGFIRNDLVFEDGVNLAQRINTKDNSRRFFQEALVLGSGEAETTKLATDASGDVSHYHQGYWSAHKDVTDMTTLQALATANMLLGSQTAVIIDNLVVWDTMDPGKPSVSTLHVGDIVNVVSRKTIPTIDQWYKILKITKRPADPNIVTLSFQVAEIS